MKRAVKAVLRKLKSGDPIRVTWEDASDDEGDYSKFTWHRMEDVLKDTSVTTIRTNTTFLQFKNRTLFIFGNEDVGPKEIKEIALRGQIPIETVLKIERLYTADELSDLS